MEQKLYIPCKSYIRKYLQAKFNSTEIKLMEDARPAFATGGRSRNFSVLIFLMLQRPPQDYVPQPKPEEEHVTIVLSQWESERYGYYISTENAQRFIDVVEEMIMQELYNYLELICGGEGSPQIQQVIWYFLDKYDIEEDELQSETLRKRYYRDRKRKKKSGIEEPDKENVCDYCPTLTIPLNTLQYDKSTRRTYFEIRHNQKTA